MANDNAAAPPPEEVTPPPAEPTPAPPEPISPAASAPVDPPAPAPESPSEPPAPEPVPDPTPPADATSSAEAVHQADAAQQADAVSLAAAEPPVDVAVPADAEPAADAVPVPEPESGPAPVSARPPAESGAEPPADPPVPADIEPSGDAAVPADPVVPADTEPSADAAVPADPLVPADAATSEGAVPELDSGPASASAPPPAEPDEVSPTPDRAEPPAGAQPTPVADPVPVGELPAGPVEPPAWSESASVPAAFEPPTAPIPVQSMPAGAPPGWGAVPPAAVTTAMRPARRHQQSFWFGLMVAVAVALVGSSFAVGAYLAEGQPQSVVQSYFTALTRGDAAAALGYGTVPDGRHDLLTDQVLAAQNAFAPINNFAVVAVRKDGDGATVDVRYTLALPTGNKVAFDKVAVVRSGHAWRLAHSAVPETVDQANGSRLATIAGSAVPSGDYPMFPGAVPAVFHTPNLVLSTPARLVQFAGDGNLLVNADVSPAGRKAVGDAFNTAFDQCLTGKAPTQVLCPLPDPILGVPGSLLGKAPNPPDKSVTIDVGSADGRIDITGSVAIQARYQKLDTNNLAQPTDVQLIDVHAHTFATQPSVIFWDAS